MAVILYGSINSHGYGRALALGGATAAGAAYSVGTIAIPTFYAVSIGAAIALGLRILGKGPVAFVGRIRLPPGATLLVLFLTWSTFVTLLAPELFDGLDLFTPAKGTKQLTSGVITSSNIAQVSYLFLGVCIVVFLARSPSATPGLIGLAAGTATVLCLWRYFHQIAGVPFPEGLFDNSPTLAFIETAPGDVHRFRGIFSEPSGLAGSCLITISYMLPRAFQVRGWRRVGTIFVAVSALYMGAISTSATFVVAGVLVALIVALTGTVGFLLRRTSLSAVVGVIACAFLVAMLFIAPLVANFVESTINQKVISPSYSQRSGADSGSYNILLDTFGLGAGLGANRASSFLAGLLSTTGVIGTFLFTSAVFSLVRRSASVRQYRPVIWALVSLLVVKVIAGPDLSDSSGILWISLGLLSHAALNPDANKPFLTGSGTVEPILGMGGGRSVP